MVIGTYISIITLNVNGLNAPIKRHRLAEWTQKQDPYMCCLQETHFRPRDTRRLKVRRWKKISHANGNRKKAGVAILISDKIDFKTNTITRDKERHYIMIKGSIQEKDITIVNIYAPNIGAPQYIRQIFSTEYMPLLHILFSSVLQVINYTLLFPFLFLHIPFPLFGIFFLYIYSDKTLLILHYTG